MCLLKKDSQGTNTILPQAAARREPFGKLRACPELVEGADPRPPPRLHPRSLSCLSRQQAPCLPNRHFESLSYSPLRAFPPAKPYPKRDSDPQVVPGMLIAQGSMAWWMPSMINALGSFPVMWEYI